MSRQKSGRKVIVARLGHLKKWYKQWQVMPNESSVNVRIDIHQVISHYLDEKVKSNKKIRKKNTVGATH